MPEPTAPGAARPAPRTLYDILGEEGFSDLTRRFYGRVADDDILGPMYHAGAEAKGEADLAPSEQRLRDFLIYRFGGPQTYIEQRGHPRLRMRHMPFAIDRTARDRWMDLMLASLDETLDGVFTDADNPRAAQLREAALEMLTQFFDQTATFMINRE